MNSKNKNKNNKKNEKNMKNITCSIVKKNRGILRKFEEMSISSNGNGNSSDGNSNLCVDMNEMKIADQNVNMMIVDNCNNVDVDFNDNGNVDENNNVNIINNVNVGENHIHNYVENEMASKMKKLKVFDKKRDNLDDKYIGFVPVFLNNNLLKYSTKKADSIDMQITSFLLKNGSNIDFYKQDDVMQGDDHPYLTLFDISDSDVVFVTKVRMSKHVTIVLIYLDHKITSDNKYYGWKTFFDYYQQSNENIYESIYQNNMNVGHLNFKIGIDFEDPVKYNIYLKYKLLYKNIKKNYVKYIQCLYDNHCEK